jgi:hypothetical protein
MFIELEGYLEYLVKHKITPNQFLFLYLRAHRDVATADYYIQNVKAWKREEIQDLVKRGYIDDVNSPGEEYVHAYFATNKFTQEMWISLDEAGDELWETYPPFFFIDGKRCAARTCDKELHAKIYLKRIKNNRAKHEKIIELLKKLKKENRIQMGIEKFIVSEQWEAYFDETQPPVMDQRVANTSEEL